LLPEDTQMDNQTHLPPLEEVVGDGST